MTGRNYRSDVDGLRGIAVALVVLFHAGIGGLGGGFVGVDIFFVISGFVITSLILREMADGRFSVLRFYERRVRRIFPALFTVLAVSCAFAAIVLLPHDLEEFADSVLAATLFVSNVYFWRTEDYFATHAHLIPLLHTWSLAVEEQFYIIFPAALFAIHRWGGGAFGAWLASLLVASFVISVWGTAETPVAAFYLAPARAWELLLGSMLALPAAQRLAARSPCRLLGNVGLLVIVLSAATYTVATPFPGWHAAAPCLGAALVILSGHAGGAWANRLLSARPVVFVGLISYSLYLWHWTVLSFGRHWSGGVLSPYATAFLIGLSVVLAVLSWKYIEQPFRDRTFRISRRAVFGCAAAAMATTVVAGVVGGLSNGWPSRFGGYDRPEVAGREAMREGSCLLLAHQEPRSWAGVEQCRRGGDEDAAVVVWGDSFASHLGPGFDEVGADGVTIVEYAANRCPPVFDLELADRPHCRAFNDHALHVIDAADAEVVLLSARWHLYIPREFTVDELQATVDALNEIGVKVALLGQSPSFDFAHPYDYVYRKGEQPVRVSFSPELNRSLASISGARFFDPLPVLCDGAVCPLRDGADFLYFDSGHFSVQGASKVASAFLPEIEQLAAAQ